MDFRSGKGESIMPAAVEVVTTGWSNVTEAVGGAVSFGLASGTTASVIGGAVIGGLSGGITAAVLGGDVVKGALAGGLIGGTTGGIANYAENNFYNTPSMDNAPNQLEDVSGTSKQFMDNTEIDNDAIAQDPVSHTAASMATGDISSEDALNVTSTSGSINGMKPDDFKFTTDVSDKVSTNLNLHGTSLQQMMLVNQQNQNQLMNSIKKAEMTGGLLKGAATGVGGYLQSRSQEKQAKEQRKHDEEMLREKYRLEEEDRKRRYEGYKIPSYGRMSITPSNGLL